MAAAADEAVTITVKLLNCSDRAALVRCNVTGREGLIPLAYADLAPHANLSPGRPLHALTVPADLAREAGLL